MPTKNANIDYCGIRNLLHLLAGQGFTEEDRRQDRAGNRCDHHFLLSFTTQFQ